MSLYAGYLSTHIWGNSVNQTHNWSWIVNAWHRCHINSSIIFLQHFYVQCFLVRHTTDRSSLMLDPNKYDLSISIIDAGIYAAYVANYLSLNSSTTLIQRLWIFVLSPTTNVSANILTTSPQHVLVISRKFGTKSHFGKCHTEAFVAVLGLEDMVKSPI